MKVWFFSTYDQPKGPISRTYDYSQELIKRGHRVTLFTNSFCHRSHVERLGRNETWRIEDVDGIRVVWLKTIPYKGNGWKRGLNMVSYAGRSHQAVKTLKDKPDVVIGDSVPPASGWIAARIAKKHNAAFVYQIRDVWPIILVYNGALSKNSLVYYAFRFIEKKLYKESHKICATIPNLHEHVAKSGADPSKITWVPNGVNLKNYYGFNEYSGGEDSSLVAMYVGAFGHAHDVITIVRAAKIIQEKGKLAYRFILVGDGVKKEECRAEAYKLGLSNIEFHDSVKKHAVPMLQQNSDILIASVTDSDAYKFGLNLNKLYDYFASGRPVIFSGRAPNDPVSLSKAGYSIPPENPDAMAEALEAYAALTSKQRKELGKKALQFAEKNFDVRKLSERMESLLIEAIKKKKDEQEIRFLH